LADHPKFWKGKGEEKEIRRAAPNKRYATHLYAEVGVTAVEDVDRCRRASYTPDLIARYRTVYASTPSNASQQDRLTEASKVLNVVPSSVEAVLKAAAVIPRTRGTRQVENAPVRRYRPLPKTPIDRITALITYHDTISKLGAPVELQDTHSVYVTMIQEEVAKVCMSMIKGKK
jgi:hypothetical protein